MAKAGYCHDCQAYVWLDDSWRCPVGHDPRRVNGWYDAESGAPLTPEWAAPVAAPAPTPAAPPLAAVPAPAPAPPVQPDAPSPSADRNAVLTAIVAEFGNYPDYTVVYGGGGDIAIDNKVADGSYGTGVKKVDFEAVLKAVETERTIYYWEILKEKGAGLSFGGFEAESYSTMGGKRWGTKKEVLIGPGGTVAYEWDYGQTRQIVESVAGRLGWRVKTVLRKGSAQW
jgi:hypothetical protein